jgi:molybdate transport system regulatory protein
MKTKTAGNNKHDQRPPYKCKARIWLEGTEGTFLGYGRVVLLERIDEFGSIAKAARSMNMSYKHAWDLVDSMNRQAPEPMIKTAAGGKGGGGTKLTEAGKKAIKIFQDLHGRLQDFLENETQALKNFL